MKYRMQRLVLDFWSQISYGIQRAIGMYGTCTLLILYNC